MAVAGAIVGGAALAAEGSNQSRRSADDAGKAAWYANRDKQWYRDDTLNQVRDMSNEATVAGLASFDQDIARQEKNLARQEQLISQIDPTVIEASQQALRLLKGESSSTLAPLQNQRSQARQKLLGTLREQLGPGAETSTAGIQALTRFDAETSNIMAGAQQQALGQLGQTAGQFNAVRPDMLREILGQSGFGQGKTGLRQQHIANIAPLLSARAGDAGGQYVREATMAQQGIATGNMWGNFGGQLMGGAVGFGMNSLAGAKAPKTASTPGYSNQSDTWTQNTDWMNG